MYIQYISSVELIGYHVYITSTPQFQQALQRFALALCLPALKDRVSRT